MAVSAAVLLAACGGEPSDEEATAVAVLGSGPAPSIEGASMFRAGPSRDGVYHVDGPPETAKCGGFALIVIVVFADVLQENRYSERI